MIDNLQVRLDDYRKREQRRGDKRKNLDELKVSHTHKHIHEVNTPISPDKAYYPFQLQMPPPPNTQPVAATAPIPPPVQIVKEKSPKNAVRTERYAELLRDYELSVDRCHRMESENEMLRTQANSLQSQVHDLSQQRLETEVRYEQLRKRHEITQEEVKTLRDRLNNNQVSNALGQVPTASPHPNYLYEYTNEKVEKEFAIERAKQLETEKEKAENELFEAKVQCEKLQIDVNSLRKKEREKQNKFESAISNYEKSQETIQFLEEKVHKYKKRLQKEIEIQQLEQDRLIDSFTQQKAQYQSMLKKREEERKEDVTQYEEIVTKLRSEIDRLEREVADREHLNESRFIKDQQEQQTMYKQQLDEYKKRNQQQLQQIREQNLVHVQQLQTEREELEKQFATQRDQLQNQIEQQQYQRDLLQQQLLQHQAQVEQLQLQMERLREESQQQVEKIREDSQQQLERLRAEAKGQADVAQEMYKTKLSQLKDQHKKQLDEQIENAKKKLVKRDEKAETLRLEWEAELASREEKYNAERRDAELDLESAQRHVSQLQHALTEEKEERQMLRNELENARKNTEQLAIKIDELQRSRMANLVDDQIQTVETAISLENLLHRQEQYDSQIDFMSNEVRTQTVKLQELERQNEKLNKQLEEAHQHLITSNSDIRNYVTQLEASLNENAALRNTIIKLEGEVDMVHESRRSLEKEVKKRNRFISTFVQPILK
jgi:chromosome segregation ATPase